MNSLTADIGGTRIKVALVTNCQIVDQSAFDAHSAEGLRPQLARLASELRLLCHKTGIRAADCSALSIAFPALVEDGDTPRVLTAYGKYADAPNVDLSGWAREELGITVMIENDARMALLGEWKIGAGRGSDDVVMVTLGTGLGTAALIQGQILRGRHGQAGILGGHLTVQQRGKLCTCGNRGCAEAEASTSVLSKLAEEQPGYHQSQLRMLDTVDCKSLFLAARHGDSCAIALRAHCIRVWSALLVNLIHAYDPERLIIGGGIMQGREDFFEELKEAVSSNAHTPWGRVEIVPAELGDAAALLGGDVLIRQRLAERRASI